MTWFGVFGYLNDLTKGGEGSGIKGHTTYREKVKKFKDTFEWFEDWESKHKNDETEHALIGTLQGSKILEKEGEEDQIKFTDSEIEDIRKHNGVIAVHNHPNGSSFSFEDIAWAQWTGAKVIRVVGEKYTHTAIFNNPISDKELESFRKLRKVLDQNVREDWLDKVEKGTISFKEADQEFFHEIWVQVLKERPLFEYVRTENE